MESSQTSAFVQMTVQTASTLGRGKDIPTGPLSVGGREPMPISNMRPADRAAAMQETPPFETAPTAPVEQHTEVAPSGAGASAATKASDGSGRKLRADWQRERAETEALKEKVDGIQVSLVMQALGGIGNQDRLANKYKIPGVGNFSVDGQRWYHFGVEKGGVGPVNLVKYVLDIPFHESVRWLASEYGEKVDDEDIRASADSLKVREKSSFEPPMRMEKHLSFVKHYLHYTRAIPMELIEQLIEEKKIYADEKKNCVFFAKGIAEIRSTWDGDFSFKGLAPGSTRQFGFLVKADPELSEKKIGICESSIDSMSYRTLNPGRSAISAAGANREFPRKVAEDAIANGYGVVAAFDADEAGDKAAQALFNHFFVKLWIKHQLRTEQGKTLDNDELFRLLDEAVIDYTITFPEGDARNASNVVFFGTPDPFADKEKPPVIYVTVHENPHGIPPCSDVPVIVSPQAYEYVVGKLGLTRDRPVIGKDWNETVKQKRTELGTKAKAEPASTPKP